jgi:hypothetical protein
MNAKDFAHYTDDQLLEAAKNMRPSPWTDAFLIGFLAGVIIYGVAANAKGFMLLIPLFLIYLFLKKPRQYKALQEELRKRNLQ